MRERQERQHARLRVDREVLKPGEKLDLIKLGEGLPYSMWRIDHRNAWVKTKHKHKAKKKPGKKK